MGADWWDACHPHGKTLGKYEACILCALELANEIRFLLLKAGWISAFTSMCTCFTGLGLLFCISTE